MLTQLPTIRSIEKTPLVIFQSVLAAIEAETLKWPDHETGGELFGYFTYAGWPVVHQVVNANDGVQREVATFRPDADQIRQEGRQLIDHYALQHLGQWHSHHRFALTRPSGGDRGTVADAIRIYGLRCFTQVITNVRGHGSSFKAIAHAYLYHQSSPNDFQSMPWLVLPGRSPLSDPLPHLPQAGMQLEPQVVTWRALRGEDRPDGPAPGGEPSLWARLGEELRLLSAAGVVARGRPAGNRIRIDAERGGCRLIVLLPADFPASAPSVFRVRAVAIERPPGDIVKCCGLTKSGG